MKEVKQEDKKIKFSNFIELLPFLKPFRLKIFFAFIALLVTAVMVLLFGKIIKYLIDFGFVKGNLEFINLALIGFIVSVLVMSVAGYYRSSLVNSIAEKVIAAIRKKTYDHVIKLSPEFFVNNKAGDVISRLTVDTTLLYAIISNTVSFLLRNTIFFIGGVFLLFLTSPKLSMISLLIIPVAICPIIILGKKVKALSTVSQSSLSLVSSRIEETINGIKTVQSFLCEKKEYDKFSNSVDNFLRVAVKKIELKSLMVALVIIFAFGGIALVLFIGGRDVINGNITSGELSSFIFYSIIIATSLVSLSQIAGQLQTASAALGRVFTLLKVESPVKEIEFPKHLASDVDIDIKFENVDFSYFDDEKRSVLKDFTLEIKPKEKIAIVGASGAGKSTIFQLLLRFHDCNSGKILLNDTNIKDLSFSSLRENFSYISQDCFIFSDTVFNNIAYFDKSVSKEKVEELLNKNQTLNFIKRLPNGLDHFVGEKGVKLSGGERQRLAIARAILKDSPIFLFDEATSALDNENERVIGDLIDEISKDKTVIIIAHKLSSIINCDRIIYLHDGKIAESGTHKELIKLNGFYKKMYESEISE